MMLRKDLADSGKIKGIADLKGTKISITSLGSLADQYVQMIVEQAGLKPNDIEVVIIPLNDSLAALSNKAVTAAYTMEPTVTLAVQQGFAAKWLPVSPAFGGSVQTATIVFGSALLKDQELGRRWMVAYLKGIRDYVKAFTTKEGRQEVIDILVKTQTVKDRTMHDIMEMPYLDPNGMPDGKSMDLQYKWFVEKGLYTGKRTFNDLMDRSFVDHAVQKLGKP